MGMKQVSGTWQVKLGWAEVSAGVLHIASSGHSPAINRMKHQQYNLFLAPARSYFSLDIALD